MVDLEENINTPSDNKNQNSKFDMSVREIQELIDCAKKVRTLAYCPYSNFAVGAAVKTESGEIFTGCNVENSSFSSSICAERTAIAKAVSEGHKNIVACAVVAHNENSYVYPCGACRQVLAEFTDIKNDMKLYLANPTSSHKILCTSIKQIIPFLFPVNANEEM
jgi:cytidine deaminase